MASKTTKTGSKRIQRTLNWSITDAPPVKRWWWYLGLIVGSLWLGLLLIALRQWTALAVLFAIVVTVLVVYRWKPREVDVRLDAKNVVINRQVLPLKNYQSFRLDGEGTQIYIVLVPKKRFALPVWITPTRRESLDQQILANLEKQLPYVETESSVLDRMARWLRLN